MFKIALLLHMENNCQIIVKAMHKCTSYGPEKSRPTHAHVQTTHHTDNAHTYTELTL